mgnify:CR=1 FL=1
MKPSYSLDDMRLFWLVAQAGSFRQAAEQVGIPPSTLSRRINALEQALGLRLLPGWPQERFYLKMYA